MTTKIKGGKKSRPSVKDPVCGATIDSRVSLSETEQGKDYYFCSEECRQKFNDNPGGYIPD